MTIEYCKTATPIQVRWENMDSNGSFEMPVFGRDTVFNIGDKKKLRGL